MCYSAQIEAEYRAYVRLFGPAITLSEFYETFYRRAREAYGCNVPMAVEEWFRDAPAGRDAETWALIQEHRASEAQRLEADLFVQRRRLADAERKLAEKANKTREKEAAVAGRKVDQVRGWLTSLHRTELRPSDARIYPKWLAPVVIWEDGRPVIKPMRYQCRPAGAPANYDARFPGTFNARRDNLEKFWRRDFGHKHGIMVVRRFFENVDRDGKNVVLEFNPADGQPMLVACLWSQNAVEGQPDLLSFAAITDEPPPEVAAAGHDRCIVPLRPENIDAWLQPSRHSVAELQAMLDDRQRPYYEHRLAA